MFTKKVFFLIVYFTVGLCEAGYYITDSTFQKCDIKNIECHRKAFEALLFEAKTGMSVLIPEFRFPPMDPHELENTTISIPGIGNLTMSDAKVEGATNCLLTKFNVDVDRRITTTESFCERITLSGRYQILTEDLVKELIGYSVSGDGNGKIQIDNMTLKMKIPFTLEKINESDDIDLVPIIPDSDYSTTDIENISFGADNIMIGNQEVSQELIEFVNRNWKTILKYSRKIFSKKIKEKIYFYLEKYFHQDPTTLVISYHLMLKVRKE